MKRVRVIATGGTIASKVDPATGGAVPSVTGEELVAALPGVERHAEVSVEQFSNVPSQALSLEQMLALGRRCFEVHQRDQADGIVVTMGTNTLAECAYLLDLTLDIPEPVVVTGAMRNPSLIAPDGPRNLFDAIVTAASDEARGRGVLVCMNGQLHEPREVTKTHTMDVATFQSPGFGPIGVVSNGRALFYRTPAFKERLPVDRIGARVELVVAVEADDGRLVDAAVEYCGADGVVVAGMGGGHVPPGMVPALRRAVERGVPVVMVSRCFAGNLLEDGYGYPGGDVELRRLGVIWGGSLQGPKARIKLLLALSRTRDPEEVRALFHNL